MWATAACPETQGGDDCTVQRSIDGGATWETSETPPDMLAVPVGQVQGPNAWTPVDDDTVCLTVRPSPEGPPVLVWRTADRGATWTSVPTPCGNEWQVNIDASDAEHLWVRCAARFFRSDNAGTTCSEIATTGLPTPNDTPFDFAVLSPRTLVILMSAATDVDGVNGATGVYVSEDAGATWRLVVPMNSATGATLARVPGGGVTAAIFSPGAQGGPVVQKQLRSSADGVTWTLKLSAGSPTEG